MGVRIRGEGGEGGGIWEGRKGREEMRSVMRRKWKKEGKEGGDDWGEHRISDKEG